MCSAGGKKFPTLVKNVNTVDFGLGLCSKHDVSSDRRHESSWIRLKDSCQRNKVVFDESGSFIENKRSSERLWMREENGVYVLDVYVASPDCHERGRRIFAGREFASIIPRKTLQ